MTQTIASIASQSHTGWRGVIVANTGSDLPALPPSFSVEWVDFPPNPTHDRGLAKSKDEFLDAFRVDKGSRVLKGMLRTRDSDFFMIVDDDDFVSAQLARHVSLNSNSKGWVVRHGYIWGDGGNLLLEHDDFNDLCGTSLIVRRDVYNLPDSFESADIEYIKGMLGGHKRIHTLLAAQSIALETLPFRGAIYRIGQSGSHSQAPGLIKKFFLSREALRRPSDVLKNLLRLRFVGQAVRAEFFGKR